MKKYIKADIVDLPDESLSVLTAMAKDPNIRPATVEALAKHPDAIIRFNLLENPGIPDKVKSELRIRNQGRWVNFTKCYSEARFDCRLGTAAYDPGVIEDKVSELLESEGAICENVYSMQFSVTNEVSVFTKFIYVNGFEDGLCWHVSELLSDLGYEVLSWGD